MMYNLRSEIDIHTCIQTDSEDKGAKIRNGDQGRGVIVTSPTVSSSFSTRVRHLGFGGDGGGVPGGGGGPPAGGGGVEGLEIELELGANQAIRPSGNLSQLKPGAGW